ncbi:MAG: type II toxin-antitoxin system RelE/ParE family toxin [Mogibacterium sp.]|nr:type II toxin-antitoxin system RelE/ParE family toxin [Mogibacterium sp.]
MSYEIRMTRKAELDIGEAWDYISYDLLNPDDADSLLDKIDETVQTLCEMPERFAIIDDPVLNSLEIRFTRVGNYLLFYMVSAEENCVYIIRFLYERRNWIGILRGGA